MAEKTFETFVAGERERLMQKRADLFTQQQKIEEELAAVNAEMRAIDAYEAVKQGKPVPTTSAQPRARKSTGTRRSGIRDEILALVAGTSGGITRGEILEKKGIVEREDKASAQSVSNALAALKKAGKLTQDDGGKYVAG